MSARILAGAEGVVECADLLRRGDVAGVPTETVYGLAADAFQPLAVARIFEAKGRPLTDPLIVHLPDTEWLEKVVRFTSSEQRNLVEKLAAAFWPGPLTLILPKHPDLPDLVTAGSENVAVRVTSHPLFQEVIRKVGSPLAAPSANRFGRISPVSAQDVRSELGETISVILDGGRCEHGLESTILTVTEQGMEILRPGPITEDQLIKYGHIIHRGEQGSLVNTPGSLPGHYAPKKELSIIDSDINKFFPKPGTALLSFRSPKTEVASRFAKVSILSASGDLREAAANFYAALRELDQTEADMIFAESLPEVGVGVAIMDRLRRASYGSKNGTGHQGSPVSTIKGGDRLNTKAAGVVAGAVMLSRVLGLARELIFASLFGAGRGMDAFLTAFRAPNLLRDLFAEGALSTAFVTVFSQKIATDGEGSAWKLASKMATLTTIFMSLLTVLGVIFAAPLIGILAPGFPAEKAALTIQLTRIMFPFILLVSLAALVMGMLNAVNRFTAPALASSFFNIGSIAGGVVFGWLIDPSFGEKSLIGLSLGTLLGGLLQLGVQFPDLIKAGFRLVLDFRWNDPGVRRVLILMVPAVIAASAVQINVMVNSIFASYLGDGPVSWLSYAFRLMQLPLGVFGVALATVTLPVVSRASALGDMGRFRSTLAKAMRLAVFLTLPSAVGLVVLAQPIISLIYQRGKFHDTDSLHTAEALQYYAIGLVGYSCIKVLSPAFYAIDRKWTPMTVSFLSIGINLLLNWLFIFRLGMGHCGLALSTAIAATVNFSLLYFFMTRVSGSLETLAMCSTLGRCLLATLPIALVGWLSHPWIASLGHAPILLRAGALFSVISVAVILFLAASWILRIEGFNEFRGIISRKLRRKQVPAATS